MNSETKIIVGIVIVCVLILGGFVWLAPKSDNLVAPARDTSILVRETSHMTGKPDAKVTLVEFADFQCPACASLSPIIKLALAPYMSNPDFNFVYRHFPLEQHANAKISAEAAEAAAAQGKYFEMGELLYKNQSEWDDVKDPTEIFVNYAQTLGLNADQFRQDLRSHKYLAHVESDLADAISLVLTHTPTFFINGVEVTDLNSLRGQIDMALAK